MIAPRSHAWLSTLLFAGSIFPASTFARTPAINVAVKAPFNAAPYLLELLETAAEENSTSYFPLLDRIADGYFASASTDQELYTSFLELLRTDGHITQPEPLSSFQLALSIHAVAPRIEAHYQYYATSAGPSVRSSQGEDCANWVAFGGKQYCSAELEEAREDLGAVSTHELPFDRILGDPASPLSSIFYADITSPDFAEFHKTISKTAREGKTSYRIRYRPSPNHAEPLLVNGYGVELALKRTDYIVIDDRKEGEEAAEKPAKAAEAIAATLQEDEEIADVKPLSFSELEGLGLKTASFVLGSEDPLDTLLRVTQDFPKHSSVLSGQNVSAEFLAEWTNNTNLALPQGYNVLWINGLQVAPRQVDAFSLLDHLRRERKLIGSAQKLGLTGSEAINLLSSQDIAQTQAEDEPQRYEFRDTTEGGNVIVWLNDIEKDKRYEDWPTSMQALLQRQFPGQLPQVRRDIHNIVVPTDFSNLKDVSLLLETVRSLIQRRVPIRWGIVPVVDTADAVEQARIFYHLIDTYGVKAALSHFEIAATKKGFGKADKSAFDAIIGEAKVRKDQAVLSFSEVSQHEALAPRLESAKSYLQRLAVKGPEASLIVNGVIVTRDEEWMQTMSNRIGQDLRLIQRGVFEALFTEDSWLPEYFMFTAALKRNPLVIPEDEKSIRFLDVAKLWDDHEASLVDLPKIAAVDAPEEGYKAQMMVIGYFDDEDVLGMVRESVKAYATNQTVEILYLHNLEETSSSRTPISDELFALSKKFHAIDPASLLAIEIPDSAATPNEEARTFWKAAQPFVRDVGLKPGETGVLINGRLIGPIHKNALLTKEDFESAIGYETRKRIEPVAKALKEHGLLERITSALQAAKITSLVAQSTVSDVPEGMFENTNTMRMGFFDKLNSTHSAIEKGDRETATVQIVASIDPTSETAQRWVPIIKVLSELDGVHLRLFVNPKQMMSELPIKRFYRYVLSSKPSFDEAGAVKGVRATFSGIPAEALLTIGMDVPPSWLVAPEDSPHDLDNIKLSSLKSHDSIDALYGIKNILIEGHSRDLTAGIPPRGAQLVLSTEKDPLVADTLIMANIGYFQFKANPGYYKIALQKGRSSDIFNMESLGTKGYGVHPGDETQEVALMSFQGLTLFPRLSRKAGKEEEDVLEAEGSMADDLLKQATGMADSLLSKVGLGGRKTADLLPKAPSRHADINIFSVASGHLYERMLNIMILSVLKHTTHSVKFWFIEQFLSPSFKSFLPHLAAHYNFQYEMVTYKWPHWLRGQKEKQREIWGYKILFLDVLFPLDLDKVIFVDADQIVRTDMHELVTLDLQGKPYGFTPMCDSRTEMEGFRFWKQGYWKSFLRGLPYHISALYVVDLKRFRGMAAGDRLRQQYHQLSADPNSLSNLDQDLPNNMQMTLPIHSLPQEWLWCETWCSDESLKDAKTIDLCNNPQTKEPKLDRARRQVPEWTVYDEEIAEFARSVKGGERAKSEQELENEREFEEKQREKVREEQRRENEGATEEKKHDEL